MNKIKKALTLFSISLLSNAAIADIKMNSLSLAQNDVCSKIDGQWAGSGTVKTNIGPIPITCHYSGNGNLVMGPTPGTFVMDIILRVGSGVCPDNVKFNLPGNCHDGVVDLKTDNANLNGTISPDGKSAELNGTVVIAVMGREATANVEDMHLTKQ